MTPELLQAYAEARRPYLETNSPMPPNALLKEGWRFVLEINTACNLRCTLCFQGNRKGYLSKPGIMDESLEAKILDKIQTINPTAGICLYGNSEGMLHPQFARSIRAVKSRGLEADISLNLNTLKNVEEVLAAQPSSIVISVSGFTQEVYELAHKGGDIEVVKRNMAELAAARKKTGNRSVVKVHYHVYRDNWGAEYDNMRAFAHSLGFEFISSFARCITLENSLQYLRAKEQRETGAVPEFLPDSHGNVWSDIFPPTTDALETNMKRLCVSPADAVPMYQRFPVPSVCPIGGMITYIRHDGRVQLCAFLADQRLTVGNFLEMTQEQIEATRRGNPICRECLRYRQNMYFHIVDMPAWDRLVADRFPEIPKERRKI